MTISDAIGAGALRGRSIRQRAVAAAAAGIDLILCAVTDARGNRPPIGEQVLGALTAAIAKGRISTANATAAAARVLALRAAP